MKVWVGLYTMVWLVFFELLVAIDPTPPSWFLYLHAALGVLIIWLAAVNYVQVRATSAPGRTKRTVRATLWLAASMAFLGIFLWLGMGVHWPELFGFSFWDLVDLLHAVIALAIIAQAASAATAFDMWEEREFERSTRPGEVPPPPSPTA